MPRVDKPVSRKQQATGDALSFPVPRIGTRLGKYLITGLLGQGGMGVVYQALDTVINRRAALKVLSDRVAGEPTVLRRFLREAKAAAQINHPNVVALYEADIRDGIAYIAMELVQGVSAAEMLKLRGPLNWQDATRWLVDACRGVEAAHAAGLIHRDIKPANLVRGSDSVAKVLDFGLVKNANSGDSTITVSGEAIGTPHYMSPEQCQCLPLDARSDVYSLGVTYYELLVGRPPYTGDALEIIHSHCIGPVPDPRHSEPNIPDQVAHIVMRAMAKDVGQRYPAVRHMRRELVAVLEGSSASANSGSSAVIALTPRPRLGAAPSTPSESNPVFSAPSTTSPRRPGNSDSQTSSLPSPSAHGSTRVLSWLSTLWRRVRGG